MAFNAADFDVSSRLVSDLEIAQIDHINSNRLYSIVSMMFGSGMLYLLARSQMTDPVALGVKIREMVSKVRKNSGMDGLELD